MATHDFLLPPDVPPEHHKTYGDRINAKRDAANRARVYWYEAEEELRRTVAGCPHESKRTVHEPTGNTTTWECVDCGARFHWDYGGL